MAAETTMQAEVPRGEVFAPVEVTPERLTEILRRAKLLAGGTVSEVTYAPLDEQGQTSEVGRLSVRYEGDAGRAPASLVGKFTSPHDGARGLAQMLGSYRREARFYQESGGDLGIPIPRCYYSAAAGDASGCTILMEDMHDSRSGGFFRSSPDDVDLALAELAPFQARWWNDASLTGSDFVVSTEDRAFLGGFVGAIGSMLPACRERFGAFLPDYTVRALEKFVEGFDATFEGYLQEGPRVMAHCDFHMKQMFFPTEVGGRFAVFDWQTVSAAKPSIDLARMVVNGLSPADQATHARRMVEGHHRRLLELGVTGYDADRAMRDFRHAIVWSLGTNVVAAAMTDVGVFEKAAEGSGVDWREAWFGWGNAAAERFDLVGVLGEV